MFCVGVLALQGSFAEHLKCLDFLGIKAIAVKTLQQAKLCQAFIIPGGESTVIARLMQQEGLLDYIRDQHQKFGAAVWGTCAGAIICAKQAQPKVAYHLGLIDVQVERNGYGAQLHSAITELYTCNTNASLGKAVLIRAPKFINIGKSVTALVQDQQSNVLSLASKRCLITSFHPELLPSQGFNWHTWFVEIAQAKHLEFTNIDASFVIDRGVG